MAEFTILVTEEDGHYTLEVRDASGKALSAECRSSFDWPEGIQVVRSGPNTAKVYGNAAQDLHRDVTAVVKLAGAILGEARVEPRKIAAATSLEAAERASASTAQTRESTEAANNFRGGNGNGGSGITKVGLQRSTVPETRDEILWVLIRHSTNNLRFDRYEAFMESVLCGEADLPRCVSVGDLKDDIRRKLRLPFPGVEPYRQLKAITEVFLQVFCGVQFGLEQSPSTLKAKLFTGFAPDALAITQEDRDRVNGNLPSNVSAEVLWDAYLRDTDDVPYLKIIGNKLLDAGVSTQTRNDGFTQCMGILQEKLLYPCFVELIWSYWHEEGMLAQTMFKLSDRFQNRRTSVGRDPLANLEIDPLRPLNNFFWGYIQDEQHRLSVRRRAHEYDHHYGMTLHGKAVGELRTADRRSKFIESFHNLLHECAKFHRHDDDTTVIADGFRVLNAVKETHYVVAQGAHNQFGDLPVTSRQEMLIEQWLLARPEMREFLGGRVMVPYPEAWMDRVDTMKSLQGWTDVSVVHFRDLAVYGEQILLSVRYGGWSKVNDPNKAANWARYWRAEIQSYLHAYRAVTGVDLASEVTAPQQLASRYLPPSVHLRNRLVESSRR